MPPINSTLFSYPRASICTSCWLRLQILRPVTIQRRGLRTRTTRARKEVSPKVSLQQQPLPSTELPVDEDAVAADREQYVEYQKWQKLSKEGKYDKVMQMLERRTRDLKKSVREDRIEILRDIYGDNISMKELRHLEAEMYDEDQAEVEEQLDKEEDKYLEHVESENLEDMFRATFDDLLKNMDNPDVAEEAKEEEKALLDMEKDVNALETTAKQLEELVNAAKGEDGEISEQNLLKLQKNVERMSPEMADTVRALKQQELENPPHSGSENDIEESLEALTPPEWAREIINSPTLDVPNDKDMPDENAQIVVDYPGGAPDPPGDDSNNLPQQVTHLSLTKRPIAKLDLRSWLLPADLGGTSEAYIRHLNSNLVAALQAADTSNGKTVYKTEKTRLPYYQTQAWKWYILSRQRLLSAPKKVSLQAWAVMWEVLCAPLIADRMAHINYLGSDMIQAGVSLTDEQRLAYIEAKYIHGDKDIALKEWAAARVLLGYKTSKRIMKDFWTLGVWTNSQHGHLDLAFEAADHLFQIEEASTVFRVLIDILRACLDRNLAQKFKTTSTVQIAWAMYVRLLMRAKAHMQMADFDDIADAFLHAKQPELALAVFKDMMLSGEKESIGDDSIILHKRTVGSDVDLWTVSPDQREIRWEDSRALAKLPSQYNNKYFFGKWIKKLIGDGELDYASQIVDLMRQRGIRPDATCVNGLIGAWLRLGTDREQKLGEELAWKMIATRIEFVQQRKKALGQNFIAVVRAVVTTTEKPAFRSPLATPQATIETFSVLIENYRIRQKQDLMTDVYDALGKAEIRPNTFFMNQVIMSDARAHRRDFAWEIYQHLVYHVGVKPDFDTFYALWTIAKSIFDPLKTRPWKRGKMGFPDCRSLFAEMIKQRENLSRKTYLSDHLYELILRSFGVADDQVGMAVAIQACALHFKKSPMEGVVRQLLISLARVGQQNIVGLRPRRLNLNDATKRRLAQVSQILATFQDQRMEELAADGVDITKMTAKTKASESVLIMSKLLRYVVHARLNQAKLQGTAVVKSATELSRKASQEMGVPYCDPWRDRE